MMGATEQKKKNNYSQQDPTCLGIGVKAGLKSIKKWALYRLVWIMKTEKQQPNMFPPGGVPG